MSGGAVCRSCGQPILWGYTRDRKRAPIDPWEDPEGNLATRVAAGVLLVRNLGPGEKPRPGETRRVSHFATCPAAARHSKPRPRPQPTLLDDPTLEGM